MWCEEYLMKMIVEKMTKDLLVNFSSDFLTHLIRFKMEESECHSIMILGIGSAKKDVYVDNLGPLVGSLLKEKELPEEVLVYGTMEQPLHFLNLPLFLEEKQKEMANRIVLAIDAACSFPPLGAIIIQDVGIYPGIGIGKRMEMVGDVSIIARTTDIWMSSILSVKEVYHLSEVITQSCLLTIDELETCGYFASRNNHKKKFLTKNNI